MHRVPLRAAPFHADITPPIGFPLCAGWYPAAESVEDPLCAHGVVLVPDGQDPIVLCALDWAELSNGEHEAWRRALADAAGTLPERVAVQCTHCHDAPWTDRDAQAILDDAGWPGVIQTGDWNHRVIAAVANAVRDAMRAVVPITEILSGAAMVEEVASNRRILGADGTVRGVRWTRCRDAELRAEPEGTIDPILRTIAFVSGDRMVAALHAYTVHPTSHDGTGRVSREFVGLARDRVAAEQGFPQIYFTGCAGDVTTGKYNDGAGDYRELFTQRVACAMRSALAAARRVEVREVRWRTVAVMLPPRGEPSDADLEGLLCDPSASPKAVSRAALILAYRRRYRQGIPILLGALHLGEELVWVHTPGEMFVEYQLEAQALRPDATVVVAAYGDCGPGYVPLARSYAEGGYEPLDAFCSEASEARVREALATLVAREPTP